MGKKRKKKKVLLSGSDPFYLSKKLRRRRYGEVSAQTSQKSQNRALVKKKVAYRAPAAQACTPPTWTINRIFSKSEILAESLIIFQKKKKKKHEFTGKNPFRAFGPARWRGISPHMWICPENFQESAGHIHIKMGPDISTGGIGT